MATSVWKGFLTFGLLSRTAGVWDENVGDWPVTSAGLACLSVGCAQMPDQAAPVSAWLGPAQVCSHRLLASRQRRVRMP